MTQTEDALTLAFPARSGYLRVCRITTTTFAAGQGFDVDQLDDLRLAVDEAVTWLMSDEEAGGEVRLALQVAGSALIIRGDRTSDDLPDRAIDDLVHAILGATLDSYELESEDGRRSIRLEKEPSPG